MRRKAGILVLLALVSAGLVSAGDLEPSGPPAPTGVTLQQIADQLDGCVVGSRCRVAKTRQTTCSDEAGTVIPCAGTGQDGEYQPGVSVDPRFTFQGDGTVRDNLTGLTWLQNPDCFGLRIWTDALSDAQTLADGSCGLTDASTPGAWRLPNLKELSSLIDFSQWHGGPAGFSGVHSFPGYWSSTSSTRFPDQGWVVFFGGSQHGLRYKTDVYYVWPVRGGL